MLNLAAPVMGLIVQKRRDAGATLQTLGLGDRHRPGLLRETIALRIRIRASEAASERCKASEPRISTVLPRGARSGLQYIQHPATFSALLRHARPACTLGICLEQGGGVTAAGESKIQHNLTPPSWQFRSTLRAAQGVT
jgi:hypothetical protein